MTVLQSVKAGKVDAKLPCRTNTPGGSSQFSSKAAQNPELRLDKVQDAASEIQLGC